jgi:hypothetical protein
MQATYSQGIIEGARKYVEISLKLQIKNQKISKKSTFEKCITIVCGP